MDYLATIFLRLITAASTLDHIMNWRPGR